MHKGVELRALQGCTTLVLGLGASGLSMARWCARLGARVLVLDNREAPPALAQLHASVPQAEFLCGSFDAEVIERYDVQAILKSPGLSPAEVEPIWTAAQTQGLYTGGELGVFAQALRALNDEQGYAPQVLAITGSNGKTTVTAMTGLLLKQAGLNTAIAGNIGLPLLDTLAVHLEAQTLPQAWVLELSSFQLDSLNPSDGFAPHAAAILNISEDHLDWHGSMQAYCLAKAKIWAHPKTIRIVNHDDAASTELLRHADGFAREYADGGRHQESSQQVAPCASSNALCSATQAARPTQLGFGKHSPSKTMPFGLVTQAGMDWLAYYQDGFADQDEAAAAPGQSSLSNATGELEVLMPTGALRIQGQHNALNALAALALCKAIGQQFAPLLAGLRAYHGEPHRVETLGVWQGVEYFDDSKGTNVGATLAALEGLGKTRKVVLIAGGQGKGQDFLPLALALRRYARAAILLGQDADLIAKAIAQTSSGTNDCAFTLERVKTMAEAVQVAAKLAQSGDVVLLSPACASLDMYRDYHHRGQDFAQAVRALVGEQGGL